LQARRYQIVETLGEGGFGTVYRANLLDSEGFRKEVALKILHRDRQLPEEMVPRLRDEARILGLLRHPAIIGVDGLVFLDAGWAVVMEYVAGVDLNHVLASAQMPIPVALEIVEEIADALMDAYNAPGNDGNPLRLIHRDIKPSNIRLTPRGQVKVLDFGVARAEFAEREAETRSIIFGSVRYMAPERMDLIDGPAGDIWALGVLLAECLLGPQIKPPPKGRESHIAYQRWLTEAIADRVQREHPRLNPDVAEVFYELLRTMIALEASHRPRAEDIIKCLRGLRRHLGSGWLREWAERNVIPLMDAPKGEMDAQTGSIFCEVDRNSGAMEVASGAEAPGGSGTRWQARQDSAPIARNAPTVMGVSRPQRQADNVADNMAHDVAHDEDDEDGFVVRRRPAWLIPALVMMALVIAVGGYLLLDPSGGSDAPAVAGSEAPSEPVADAAKEDPDPAGGGELEEDAREEGGEPEDNDDGVAEAAPTVAPAQPAVTPVAQPVASTQPAVEPPAAVAPEPAVVQPPAVVGGFQFQGSDFSGCVLLPTGCVASGSAPPGDYQYRVRWSDGSSLDGWVTIQANALLTIKCADSQKRCRVF
jgi:serine/threonine protein kinase